MSGQTRERRVDDQRENGRRHIQRFIQSLALTGARHSIDEPADPNGEWWVDLEYRDFQANVSWRLDRGFGVFTSDDDSYGSRPDELYRNPDLAAKRLNQLIKRTAKQQSAMTLKEVRNLLDQSQKTVADRLKKDQGFISRLENQDDALMSTVKEYIEALGGEVRVVVRFNEFEAPVDLTTRFPNAA
ncbi:helix-turn-helix domain-containing protein [Bosea massiliensis]|uniref:Helix-turn-helix domain-containing protein n=1 Tax=Bosea massiliensis TaxID=151419 RepID=A0ABW0P5G3_9HYPH